MIRIVAGGQLLERVSDYFILLWGWKRAAIAFAAGAISALALPPFDAFPVLFLTLAVFVWLMDATASDPPAGPIARLRRGFVTSWCFGFGYFLAGLWWIGLALLVEAERFAAWTPVAVLGLPAILALFWGFGGGVAVLLWRDGWPRILWFAACLGAAEFARGALFTGFPWNELGMAAMPFPLAMQTASLIGISGVTPIAISVFAVAAAGPFHRAGARFFAAFCAVLILAHFGYGAWRLSQNKTAFAVDVEIRLVQPAIPQDEKWSAEFADRSFRKLLDLSADAKSNETLDGIDLLVWPESAFAFVLTERPDALAAIAALLPDGTLLATGALRLERSGAGGPPRAFNSVYVIDADGEIVAAADKSHLVPFGEYMPFSELAAAIGLRQLVPGEGGFEAGRPAVPLAVGAAGRVLALICYEAIFPRLIAQAPRPDFILNVTNDTWFGNSPGPYQHWRQAVLGGVEFGLPVIRDANSGISSVTDPQGRVIVKLDLGAAGYVDSPLPVALATTFYARHGETPFLILIVVLAGAGLAIRRAS